MTDAGTVVLGQCCVKCGNRLPLIPLHGEKGGPLFCYMCAGSWHAEYGRRRKWARIIMKAMNMYLHEGGKSRDFNKMQIALTFNGDAMRKHVVPGYYDADTIGLEVGDITAELLADTVRLTHPDAHPPERQALAQRVTQELLALKPFVFPAPKPKEAPKPAARDASKEVTRRNLSIPVTPAYPCEFCADQVPYYYCEACKQEYRKRQQAEREVERAKERKYRENAKRRKAWRTPESTCPACEKKFKPRRKDAMYCSHACRQRAYRDREKPREQSSLTVGRN